MALTDHLSALALAAPESGIVEVVNHGRGRAGLIPLWVGEGDLPTPDFITDAAIGSLRGGDTFYTWQRGIPELREALANYHNVHFQAGISPENVFVTGSGMQAIRLAIEAVASPGGEIIHFSPAWPNFPAALAITGSAPVPVMLEFAEDGWRLDLGKVEDAIGPKTRAIFVNTPANPTGWVASRDELSALLDLARRHDLWIVADEIYARFSYDAARAPSFFDCAKEGDRILYVNSFSKNWSMTGWRVGWIVAPSEMGQILENLIQYATSGVAHFMQVGATAALRDGETFLAAQIERASAARTLLCDALLETGRVRLAVPSGSFYAFFSIDGMGDTRTAAKALVDGAGVGLAPGTAFGPGGEAFLRACFHRRLDHIETAAERLRDYINAM